VPAKHASVFIIDDCRLLRAVSFVTFSSRVVCLQHLVGPRFTKLSSLKVDFFSMDGYWGDIDRAHDVGSGIAAIERQQMTKPRPLEIDSPILRHPSGSQSYTSDEICSRELTFGATGMNLSVCRAVLKRHVATAFARAGFQSCTAECLETLTDVLYHYLQKVFQLLHVAVDSRDVYVSMPSVICQVFTELGLDSTAALEDYYKLVAQ